MRNEKLMLKFVARGLVQEMQANDPEWTYTVIDFDNTQAYIEILDENGKVVNTL